MLQLDAQYFQTIPTNPGVYLMKNKAGKVIYVGKAKVLRDRVRQYFRVGGDERFFVTSGLLRKDLESIETIVVNNEKEALLLENHLIKQHQPKFNVNLRDDKQYLVLRIDSKKKYPRVEVARNIKNDGAKYFGPYHSASSCRETLRTINKFFQLRTCSDHVLENRKRVCLQYQIKRCSGPCVYPIPEEQYTREVEDVATFLKGNKKELEQRLKKRMKVLAEKEDFESAARVRDSLRALERVLDKQRVVQGQHIDQDVFALSREGADVFLVVLFIRTGKLMGRRHVRHVDVEFPDEEVLSQFIQMYYDSGTFVPTEVLTPIPLEDSETMAEWLSQLKGKKVKVLSPQRGVKKSLIDMAKENARVLGASHQKTQTEVSEKLTQIQKRLGLQRLPRHIECYDIAHVQGSETVASRVVFRDGDPDKAYYRKFKVKEATNDDFAAMYEVLSRRVRRAIESDDDKWLLPDLIVIDGGKGQLASAAAAFRDAGLALRSQATPDMIGLAKEKREQGQVSKPERVFTLGAKDAKILRSNSHELHLLTRLRDEAHRFANTFHRSRRRKKSLTSALDNIEGIGPKRKRLLLQAFGSVAAIKRASLDDLANVKGLGKAAAKRVHEALHGTPSPKSGNGAQ